MEYPNQISLKIMDPAVDLMNCSDTVTQNFLDDAYYYSIVIVLEQIEPGTNRYRCVTRAPGLDESYTGIEYRLVDGGVYTERTIQHQGELEELDAFMTVGEIVETTNV